MKIGDTIKTVFGDAKVVAFEPIGNWRRVGVELDNNPFWYSPVYLYPADLEPAETAVETAP